MINKTISFIFLFVVFIAISCNRDCHKNHTCAAEYYEFNLDSFADYLYAKKGSYWIYKDTKTGEIDTQTSFGYKIDTIVNKGEGKYDNITIKYQVFNASLWSSRKHWPIYLSTNYLYADSKNLNGPPIFHLTRTTPGYLAVCFFYRFDSTYRSGDGSYFCKLIGRDSVLTIQGKTYYDVVKFRLDHDPTWTTEFDLHYRAVTYYWARHVGIIKREPEGYGGNIELLDYQFIQ